MSALDKEYRVFRGEERIWIVAAGPDCAGNVYCTSGLDPHDSRRAGFGGKQVTLPLVGGGRFRFYGWHSNADDLLEETGVDVTDCYATQGWYALGYDIDKGYDQKGLIDILWWEEKPIIGTFDRAERVAQSLANSHNTTIHGWVESPGGGHGFRKQPQREENQK